MVIAQAPAGIHPAILNRSPFAVAIDNYLEANSPTDPMLLAIKQAARAFGNTYPNPPVGAVLVREGQILSAGFTQAHRGPHAEALAIQSCADPQGADLYVTLEPCCHFGANPPCTDAIIRAGIKKVVIGSFDPNPKVNGKGAQILEDGALQIEWEQDPTRLSAINALLEPFYKRIQTDSPYILAKMATSQEGMIASCPNTRTKITGLETQKIVHGLRYFSDVIYTSQKTLDVDNPLLNIRYFGEGSRLNKPVIARLKQDLIKVEKILDAGRGNAKFLTAMLECGAVMFNGYLKAGLIDEFWHFTNQNLKIPNGYPMTDLEGYQILASKYEIISGPQNISSTPDVLSVYKRRKRESI